MIDVVMTTIASAFHGVGNLIEGIFGKQPKKEDLQAQVSSLQQSADQLATVFQQQRGELDRMLLHYHQLKFYQIMQKSELKRQIQEELVCQYAALDYLTILIDAVESGQKMSRADLDFYYTYCKVFADGQIDANEITELHPFMRQRHAQELDALQPCSLDHALDRLRCYRK